MTYALGIDLGTTFSAAAVHRDGRARIVELGSKSASIPSVVFLREDDSILAGDAAQRRAASQPNRVAREFKRRLGDTTPLLLGGASFSAEALTARLLRWIVDQVTEREGAEPLAIAITHPANWGPFKIDLLHQAVRLAGLGDAQLVSEPEAAVRHYAAQERVPAGSVIAVYDLGGGTFDAAILRKTETGFDPLGRPEGVERLGGIDFDAAVLGHVMRSLDSVVESLDQNDPGVVQALARLRQDCIDAKEGLSSDTDVSIPVLLPNVQTEVRLTRAEFETMIRPSLTDSLEAMRRAMTSADIAPDSVDAVLLVGGSSRVPLVAQLVSNEFGRPVAIDADPKHAIALGAALVASETATESAATSPDAAIESAEALRITALHASVDTPEPVRVGIESRAIPKTLSTPAVAVTKTAASLPARTDSGSKAPLMIGAAVAAAAALVGGLIIARGSGGDAPQTVVAAPVTAAAVAPDGNTAPPISADTPTPTEASVPATTMPPTASTAAATTSTTSTAASTTSIPVATPCPTGPARTACITSISLDADGGLVAPFVANGYVPELEPADFHLHFYFDSDVDGDERNAGTGGTDGEWRLWDSPSIFATTGGDGGRPGYTIDEARAAGATQLCSIVATARHAAVVGTGNCVDLPTSAADPT